MMKVKIGSLSAPTIDATVCFWMCVCVDFAFLFDSFLCAVFLIVYLSTKCYKRGEKLTSTAFFLCLSISLYPSGRNKIEIRKIEIVIIKTIKYCYDSMVQSWYEIFWWNQQNDSILENLHIFMNIISADAHCFGNKINIIVKEIQVKIRFPKKNESDMQMN